MQVVYAPFLPNEREIAVMGMALPIEASGNLVPTYETINQIKQTSRENIWKNMSSKSPIVVLGPSSGTLLIADRIWYCSLNLFILIEDSSWSIRW